MLLAALGEYYIERHPFNDKYWVLSREKEYIHVFEEF
jgi:hypothetical protein